MGTNESKPLENDWIRIRHQEYSNGIRNHGDRKGTDDDMYQTVSAVSSSPSSRGSQYFECEHVGHQVGRSFSRERLLNAYIFLALTWRGFYMMPIHQKWFGYSVIHAARSTVPVWQLCDWEQQQESIDQIHVPKTQCPTVHCPRWYFLCKYLVSSNSTMIGVPSSSNPPNSVNFISR